MIPWLSCQILTASRIHHVVLSDSYLMVVLRFWCLISMFTSTDELIQEQKTHYACCFTIQSPFKTIRSLLDARKWLWQCWCLGLNNAHIIWLHKYVIMYISQQAVENIDITGLIIHIQYVYKYKTVSTSGTNSGWAVENINLIVPYNPHMHRTHTRLPDSSWKGCPGRPNKRWLDRIHDDNNRPPADVWRDAIRRGHSGATQRSTPT